MSTQTIKTDDTPDIILPLVVLIIFIVFFGGMAYLLISSSFLSTSVSNPVTSDRRVDATFTCAPGQCATNLMSGFKTCLADTNASISVNVSESVCNSRFLCDNPLTPNAILSDQSTSISGVCDPGVECGCLATSQCANYITSAFTTSTGNPFVNLNGQRITFPQISTSVNSVNGVVTDNSPLQFSNTTTFCSAPISWLPLSNPGCNFVNATEINYQDIVLCMGAASGCSGLDNNPCLQGTLAFLSSNPDSLNQRNIATTQVACVRGLPCPCGMVAIFDTSFGNIVCRQLPP